jgi:hypothetical protein
MLMLWSCRGHVDNVGQWGNEHVPIQRLLQEASFDPDDIERMVKAYEAALQLLRLANRSDPLAETVARKIIEVTRGGEHDPPKICAKALKELRLPLPD